MGTRISWTNETWNVVTGCSKVSEGCRNCYAEALSNRWKWTSKPWSAINAVDNVRVHPNRLGKPFKFKPGTLVFVNSMSDLFHPLVPDEFLEQVFDVMWQNPQCVFQILTKRPERAALYGPTQWPPNVWMGTSVENADVLHRVDLLRQSSAAVRFLSVEPLLGSLGPLNLQGIAWVIVGGESGAKHREMSQAWARAVRSECVRQNVAFYYKQDAAPKTETRPWLVEEDGTCWEWKQMPFQHTPPRRIIPLEVT